MAEKKAEAWEIAARRSILGEKHELATLPGYWIRARKYSVKGENIINSSAFLGSKAIPKEVMKKLAPMMKDGKAEVTPDQMMALLEPDEIYAVVQSQSEGSDANVDVARNVLVYGIGEHNFEDVNEMRCTEALADRILDYKPVAEECLKVVREYNAPLAKDASGKS